MSKETLSPLQTELLSRADAIFASISTAVGKATDFAAVQIPDIAMQYVTFGRAYSSIVILVAIVILLIGLFLIVFVAIKNCYKIPSCYYGSWGDGRTSALIFGGGFVFVGFTLFAINMYDFLMVWFAPKIWLITELVKLAK